MGYVEDSLSEAKTPLTKEDLLLLYVVTLAIEFPKSLQQKMVGAVRFELTTF